MFACCFAFFLYKKKKKKLRNKELIINMCTYTYKG